MSTREMKAMIGFYSEAFRNSAEIRKLCCNYTDKNGWCHYFCSVSAREKSAALRMRALSRYQGVRACRIPETIRNGRGLETNVQFAVVSYELHDDEAEGMFVEQLCPKLRYCSLHWSHRTSAETVLELMRISAVMETLHIRLNDMPPPR
jgi:hypothetical protein